MTRVAAVLLAVVLSAGATVVAQDPVPIAPVPPLPPPFSEWLTLFRAEAAERGIRPEVLDRALDGVEPVEQILERDRSQAEFTLNLESYLRRRLTPAIIRTAQKKYRSAVRCSRRSARSMASARALSSLSGDSNRILAASPASVRPFRLSRRLPTIRVAAPCSATSCSARSKFSTAVTSNWIICKGRGPAHWVSRNSCHRVTCNTPRISMETDDETSGRRSRMCSPRSRTT